MILPANADRKLVSEMPAIVVREIEVRAVKLFGGRIPECAHCRFWGPKNGRLCPEGWKHCLILGKGMPPSRYCGAFQERNAA